MFIQFLASQLILIMRMLVRLGYLKCVYKFTKDKRGLCETCHIFNFYSLGHYRKIIIISICTRTRESCLHSSSFQFIFHSQESIFFHHNSGGNSQQMICHVGKWHSVPHLLPSAIWCYCFAICYFLSRLTELTMPGMA